MKIFMVHPHDIFSDFEPWTVRITNLASEFVKRGHQVKLIHFPLDSSISYISLNLNGVEIISFPRWVGLRTFVKKIIRMSEIFKWADIIHLQKCFYHAAVPTMVASWIDNKPLHYDWDDWEVKIFYYGRSFGSIRSFLNSTLIGTFLDILEKFILKVADTVSVSSARLHELCIKAGLREDIIFRAHVGADLEKFNPGVSGEEIRKRYNLKGRLVLYSGQLQGGQYAELFIHAAKVITSCNPKVTFMIVGGGFRLNELKDLARELGINKNFIFTNSISHDLVPQYIAAADIVVACFEDNDITRCKSPLKIAEYLASGKAIVASNVGGVRNMVGGVGLSVEPGNPDSLAEGIMRLLKDDELRREMGKRARERAERKYNWSQTAENLLGAYKTALNSD